MVGLLQASPSPLPASSGAVSVSSRANVSISISDGPSTPRDRSWAGATIRMSELLNRSDGDDDEPALDESDSDATKIPTACKPVTPPSSVVTKVPKKRGRKPILPSMTNSERGKYYRAKRAAHSALLQKNVDALRDTIARLVALRSITDELAVSPRNTACGSLVKLVREYFTQFRYGVQLPPARRNMALADVETSSASQEIFMRATMDPELCFGEFKGIEVVLDQWERYSKFHAFLQFELLDVWVRENDDGHIIETNGQLRTRYSRCTIENVFPHVVGNEPLIQRLIGKEVIYPCRNQFYFTPDGRVQRYDVEADFAVALQNAVGSLEDVAALLNQALIRQQHMMGELEGDELAVIEEIERRVDATGKEVPGSGREPVRAHHNMSVEYLLSDDTDEMDMND